MGDFHPYFSHGRLHLPEVTLKRLSKQGLKPHIAEKMAGGILLDDHLMEVLRKAVNQYINVAPEDDAVALALRSKEAQFMLSDDVAYR